uniref:Hexosyltransferase n=1 Tax=Megaselia scalaris TaxID=36166 RepID=T1GTG3_MEGSC
MDISKSVHQLESHEVPDLDPINFFNFSYIHKPLCETTQKTLTLIVKSATMNFLHRQAIRQSWGNQDIKYRNQTSLRTVFMIGSSESSEINSKIASESNQYSDIFNRIS